MATFKKWLKRITVLCLVFAGLCFLTWVRGCSKSAEPKIVINEVRGQPAETKTASESGGDTDRAKTLVDSYMRHSPAPSHREKPVADPEAEKELLKARRAREDASRGAETAKEPETEKPAVDPVAVELQKRKNAAAETQELRDQLQNKIEDLQRKIEDSAMSIRSMEDRLNNPNPLLPADSETKAWWRSQLREFKSGQEKLKGQLAETQVKLRELH
jgi:chromosome segregation ATPase